MIERSTIKVRSIVVASQEHLILISLTSHHNDVTKTRKKTTDAIVQPKTVKNVMVTVVLASRFSFWTDLDSGERSSVVTHNRPTQTTTNCTPYLHYSSM